MLQDNTTIISTFRVRADECDRLWVMDTGLADILGNPAQHAAPSLAIFDLYTDKLIRRHYFPDALLKEDSFFANVVRMKGILAGKLINLNLWLIIYFRSSMLKEEIATTPTLTSRILEATKL